MFHVKYAISVKREEMRQLEKLAREEEKKLVIAEKCLEEDAVQTAYSCNNFYFLLDNFRQVFERK